MIKSNRLIILLMLMQTTLQAFAKDFGTKGHTYQIIEQPFLRMIDERLQKVDMKKEQEKMTTIVKDRVHNPRAVEGLLPAVRNRIFYFDPTYTLEKDIILPCGKILHRAGTRVNPLEHMDLNRKLFFIDSRDKSQVKWLKKQLAVGNKEVSDSAQIDQNDREELVEAIEDRIILIGGSPFKLKEELGKEYENKIYFDQNGEIVGRFGIQHVPAIAQQEAMQIRIEEVALIDNEAGV